MDGKTNQKTLEDEDDFDVSLDPKVTHMLKALRVNLIGFLPFLFLMFLSLFETSSPCTFWFVFIIVLCFVFLFLFLFCVCVCDCICFCIRYLYCICIFIVWVCSLAFIHSDTFITWLFSKNITSWNIRVATPQNKKQNKTKNKTKTKQNKTKQNKTKQNKTKQNKTNKKKKKKSNFVKKGLLNSVWTPYIPRYFVINKDRIAWNLQSSFVANLFFFCPTFIYVILLV